MSRSPPPRPPEIPTAGAHLSERGVGDGEPQGGQGLRLNFVLCVTFCLFPMKPGTSEVKLRLSDYKSEEFYLRSYLNVKQILNVSAVLCSSETFL